MYNATSMRSFSLLLCTCVSLEVVDDAMDQAIRSMPAGKAISVSALYGPDFTAICVLPPRQDRLATDNADADRVNAQLKAMRYVSDENRWAFVLINRTEIEVVSFKRSAQLDIIGQAELEQSAALKQENLPPGFIPSDCASDTQAALTRFMHGDRSYIVLGKTP